MVKTKVKDSKFDSNLNLVRPRSKWQVQNAELVITLNVHLVKVQSGIIKDADGFMFITSRWNAHDWSKFVMKFKKEAEQYWSGKFWLKTPEKCTSLNYDHGLMMVRPNIYCRFNLFVTTSRGHISVRVANIGSARSVIARRSFRSHSRLYKHTDLQAVTKTAGGARFRQKTFLHEIGHALGLPHIGVLTSNPQCILGALVDNRQGYNTGNCYGVTPAEGGNIMGAGNRLTVLNALPWKRRITKHVPDFKEDQWNVSMSYLAPVAP